MIHLHKLRPLAPGLPALRGQTSAQAAPPSGCRLPRSGWPGGRPHRAHLEAGRVSRRELNALCRLQIPVLPGMRRHSSPPACGRTGVKHHGAQAKRLRQLVCTGQAGQAAADDGGDGVGREGGVEGHLPPLRRARLALAKPPPPAAAEHG